MNVTTAADSTERLNKDLPDCRFGFIEALNSGIELVCDEFGGRASDAFSYRGANLRYAVERGLYFWGANNPSLYAAFAKASSAGDGEGARERLLSELRRRLAPKSWKSSRIAGNAWEMLRRIRAHIRHRMKGRRTRTLSFQSSRGIETLFVLHHPKFTSYLRPVLAELGPSVALCAVDAAVVLDRSKRFRQTRLKSPRLLSASAGERLQAFPHFVEVFDMIRDTLRRERPVRVVVAEGNSPMDEVVKCAADSLRISTVCIQQGWSPIPHAGFRNMSYSRMLVWGEGFADLLRPFNPSQRFQSVGNPAITSPAEAAPVSVRNTVAFFLQAPSPLIDDRSWNAFLSLARWTAGKFPGTTVLVREHPNHRLTAAERDELGSYSNVEFMAPTTTSLSAVLQRSSCIVTIYSSTIMESIAVGVLPIIANFTSMPHYWPDVASMHAAIEVNGSNAAQHVLEKCLTDTDFLRSFESGMRECAARYFSARGTDAVSNIVRAIQATGENPI